jgi:hypothetical protein
MWLVFGVRKTYLLHLYDRARSSGNEGSVGERVASSLRVPNIELT